MRKVMVLVAMLAMMLVAASPAFAEVTAIDNSSDISFDSSFNMVEFGNQVGGFVGVIQVQSGDALSAATDSSAAAAAIDQSLDVSQTQTLFIN